MTDVMALVAEELGRLRGALATLSDDAWDTASLCDGWTIRHVIAHLTMPARYSPEQFGAELAAVQFDFNALSNLIAERDAQRSPAQLLDDLASEQLASWTTPDGGPSGALSHVLIHGLDATVPTGLGCVASEEAVGLVLDTLAKEGVHQHFGTTIEGRRLVADDLDWTFGSGSTHSAPAYGLVLELAGRNVPLSHQG